MDKVVALRNEKKYIWSNFFIHSQHVLVREKVNGPGKLVLKNTADVTK